MKNRLTTRLILIAALSPFALACSAIGHSTSSTGATDTPTNSDESNVEASYSTAVSFLGASNSSSSDANTSVAALTTPAALATGGTSNVRQRFRCTNTLAEDQVTLAADEAFDCNDETGILTRTVTFTDCVVSNDQRTGTIDGAFTNRIDNGGPGFCNEIQSFDFGNMVMGRTEDDVHLDAIHSHLTAEGGMIFNFTNDNGKAVTLTQTADTTRTFSNPIDLDNDGIAESTDVTVERRDTFIHTDSEGKILHSLTAFTTDTDETSTDADGNETPIVLDLPVHAITIDEDGEIDTNKIFGDFVVNHNLAKIQTVFSIGADGLTFTNDGDCNPQDGSITTKALTINDDGSIGAQIGTGTIVFVDGEVSSATYDGTQIDVRPLPCD